MLSDVFIKLLKRKYYVIYLQYKLSNIYHLDYIANLMTTKIT